jgi:hypothetical protein
LANQLSAICIEFFIPYFLCFECQFSGLVQLMSVFGFGSAHVTQILQTSGSKQKIRKNNKGVCLLTIFCLKGAVFSCLIVGRRGWSRWSSGEAYEGISVVLAPII